MKQDEYALYDGIHDAIIPEDDFALAKQKRADTGVRFEKTHSLEHEHILSGILKLNAAVEEVIRKMVNNPKFKTALKKKIGSKIDTSELDEERASLRKQLQQSIGAKNKVAEQMDRLDITDRLYDRKYEDL